MSLTKEKMENMSPEESKNNSSGTEKIVGSLDLNNASYPSSQAAAKISATGANQRNSFEKLLLEYSNTSFGGAGLLKKTSLCRQEEH